MSWGGNEGTLNFGMKKQSMPVNSLRDINNNNYHGMTSKYSLNVDTEGGYQQDGSNLT